MTTGKATKKTEGGAPALSVIGSRILIIRGHRAMLDADLAELYDVETKRINEAVHRNPGRFPEDFVFRLTVEESDSLRSQIATAKDGRGGRRNLPYAFTEQGVAMLSSVLKSERAIMVNVAIMRAFVALRKASVSFAALSKRLDELERKHAGHDENFRIVFEAIREMMNPPGKPKRKIGF